MNGIQFKLSVPYECSFIKETAVNALTSYSIPPLTTIRGMIYNAMARPSLLLQDYHTTRTLDKDTVENEYEFRKQFESSTHIGIEVLDRGVMKSDLRNRMKHGGRSGSIGGTDGDNAYLSYVVQHETIIQPTYQITILFEDNKYLDETFKALNDPNRILYLGASDNMVEVKNITKSEFKLEEDEKEFDRDIVVPNSKGENMEMLPVKMESFEGRGTADRGESHIVSYGCSEYDKYYKPTNDNLDLTVAID